MFALNITGGRKTDRVFGMQKPCVTLPGSIGNQATAFDLRKAAPMKRAVIKSKFSPIRHPIRRNKRPP